MRDLRASALIAALTAIALVSCTPTVTPEGKVQSVAFKTETAKSFVGGYTQVKVAVSKSGTLLETPTKCEIGSPKFAGSFNPPETANLPAYIQGAVPVKLICDVDGQRLASTFKPINLSKRARNQSSIAMGVLLCPICGIAMAAGNSANNKERPDDLYGYAELVLRL